jgi:uncharacterized membrane protein YfcA
VTFLASVLSGMSGGGGSIILTPFYIFIGLTPQQAVATNKFGSFGVNAGSIWAFKARFLEHKKLSLVVIMIAVVPGQPGATKKERSSISKVRSARCENV